MVPGRAVKEPQAKGVGKTESLGLKPTPTHGAGCHPRDSTDCPSRGHGESSRAAHVRESQENKGPHLFPGSQPNLQDEYVFISQKFLLEYAKVFFPLQSRQTRQVYFG